MVQLGCLSAFLASLLLWMMSVADSQVTGPQAPQLSLSPPYNIFVQGERVNLYCTIPEGQRAINFGFHERQADGVFMQTKYQKENIFEVSTTNLEQNKSFACSYLGTNSGGTSFHSALSNKVMFSIVESPEPPTLSLHPQYPIYIQGEEVSLICSALARTDTKGYTFWEEKGGQVLQLKPKTLSNTFTLDGTSTGRFYCAYWVWVARREIKSSRSNSISVTRTESPLPPNLSLQPKFPVYIQGENVKLTCSTPARARLAEYTFYKEDGVRVLEVQPKNPSNTFHLGGTTAGRYSCVYCIQVSGREIQSPRSNSASVARTEFPQPPTLSLQPRYPVYILGDEITLICSPSVEKEAAGCMFYQERSGHFSLVQSRSHNNTYRLAGKSAGMFRCMCQIQVSGREITTQQSNSVFVTRTDPLPPPVLKVDPPSGAVNEGEPLFISCLTNRSNTEKWFHFYKDRVEMDTSNEEYPKSSSETGDLSSSASLRIPQANSSHSGEFACSYEENVSNWWMPSPQSQAVNITVHAQVSSLPVPVYACFTLLFLILAFSLSCYYCWRRKRASKGKEEFQPPQSQEEVGNLRRLEPKAVALQLQVEARLKRLKPVEEDGVSYSEIQFQPLHGLNRLKPVGEDEVTYSEIQVQPTHRAAK